MFLQPERLVCWLKNSLPSQSLFKDHLISSSSPLMTCTSSLAGVLHPWDCVPPLHAGNPGSKLLLSAHCSSPNLSP